MIKEMKERKPQEKSDSLGTENKENTENVGNDSAVTNMSTFSSFDVSSSASIPGLDLIEGDADTLNTSVVNGEVNHRPAAEHVANIQNGETLDTSVVNMNNAVKDTDIDTDSANTVNVDQANGNENEMDTTDSSGTVARLEDTVDSTGAIVTDTTRVQEPVLRKVDTEDDLNPHNFSPMLALEDEVGSGDTADVSAESTDDRLELFSILFYLLPILQVVDLPRRLFLLRIPKQSLCM